MKVTSNDSIKYEFEAIHEAFKEANQLRKILKMAEKWPKKKDLDAVQVHLDKRLKRYHELNTPEMIAKRKEDATKRELARQREVELRLVDQVKLFRDKGLAGHDLYSLPNELLHIKDGEVITSRGARVPLKEAKKLYHAIRQGVEVIGAKVGHYTVQGVDKYTNGDSQVKIGCHTILLSEATRVLGVA